MGLLNRFFRSPEEVAKELALDELQLAKAWQDYADSALEKGKLINALQPGTLKQILPQLKNAVVSELVKTTGEEKTEEQLLADLKAVEHEEHIKRVKRLENTLCYAETKHEYIHQLLKELWQILNTQLHLVEQLIAGSTQEALLIQKLKESWKVEQHILLLVNERETFHKLFAALLKGEHIVRQLTSQESKFVARAEKETGITNKLLSRWTHEIDSRIHDKIDEWVASSGREEHIDSHFEFVNSPDFIPFAREIIQSLRTAKRQVSESAINTFVHLFREWYNANAHQ